MTSKTPKASAKQGKENPDDLGAGLQLRGKSLSTKSVARAASPAEVIAVCLAHNLRQRNEHHRHRSHIDPAKTALNEVLRGSGVIDVAVEIAGNILDELGIRATRRDAVMAVELVFQPPDGADTPAFWSACLAWADNRYEHIVSAVVHRDQTRPHMHVLVLAVANGRLAGNTMTAGSNRFVHQRRAFMAHMRETLGLRPDRKVKTLAELVVSTERGAKTKAQADRRDAAVVRRHAADGRRVNGGMGVDGLGGCPSPTTDPHAQPTTPTPLLRSNSHVAALWSELFENRKKAPKIAAVETAADAPTHAAAQPLELAGEDAVPVVSNATADAPAVDFATARQPKIRECNDGRLMVREVEGQAVTPGQTCANCRHLTRRGTCADPAAAGLDPPPGHHPGTDWFGIRWPPEGHGTTCPAFGLAARATESPRETAGSSSAASIQTGADDATTDRCWASAPALLWREFSADEAGCSDERLILRDRESNDGRNLPERTSTGWQCGADALAAVHFQHSTSTVKPLASSAIAVGASGLSELALA